MFVRTKLRANGRTQIQIVETLRSGERTSQKCVRSLGTANSAKEIAEMTRIGEAIIIEMKNAVKPVLNFANPEDFHAPKKREKKINQLVDPHDLREEKRINEGFSDIFGNLYEEVGLANIIAETKDNRQWNDIIQSAVIARIARPSSKLATLKLLQEEFDVKIPFQKIYRAMDHLVKHEQKVKTRIAETSLGLFKERVDVLFFDVTTLRFESIEGDELRNFGFSKDCRFKEVQVVLALVATKDGLPITYKLFPGNTFEGHTLRQTIDEFRKDFAVDNFVFVADRAMFSDENLKYMDENKIKYVIAARLKSLPSVLKNEILGRDFYPSVVCEEFQWLEEFRHKNRRLIVSYSSKRARKDAADRTRLVERMMKKQKDGKIKIKELITNCGTKKYVNVSGGVASINEAKILHDAQWDGLHGVITNVEDQSASNILARYRGLWQIEEAFRVNKHSLKMRPIFHWTPKRIKAHILICFMAYSVLKYAIYRLRSTDLKVSPEALRDELSKVQASIVVDRPSKQRYVIPAAVTEVQKRIYSAFNLRRSDQPYAI